MKDSFKDHLTKSNNPRNTFQGFPIISDQITRDGLGVVWRELEKVLLQDAKGHVVEFGCYAGTTSLFIRRLLNKYPRVAREFHVYDSFEGLPEKTSQDNSIAGVDFEAGKLYASKTEFVKVFNGAGLALPIMHKGWFNQLPPSAVPTPIAFAFLDGDFYSSIIDSLRLVWPHMSAGSTLLIDDYNRETLPGVARALHDFFQGKNIRITSEHGIAIIHIAP